MSRKRKAPVRKIYPDPKYRSVVISKFINSIMYDGKRSTAEKILYDALDKIKQKGNEDPIRVEVKGTSGRGGSVEVTRNEIRSALEEDSVTDLFVLHSIEVEEQNSAHSEEQIYDGYGASGGIIKLVNNWIPRSDQLQVISYYFTVDDQDIDHSLRGLR